MPANAQELLGLLRDIARALAPARTTDEVADAVLNAVASDINAVTSSIWLREGDELAMTHERNAHPDAMRRFARVGLDADLPGPAVMRSGQPIFLSSRAERDERWPVLVGTPSASEAMVVLPLESAGERLGVVSFGFSQPRNFSDDGRLAMVAVADQCAMALDRARLYEATMSGASANHLLARISGAIGHSHDWEQLARHAVRACTDAFVDTCVVFVREGHLVRRVAVSSRTYGESFESMVDRFPTPLSAPTPNATVIRTGIEMPVIAINPESIHAFSESPDYIARMTSMRFGDGRVVPLSDGTTTFGAMLFAAAPGESLDDFAVELAREVADRTSGLIRSASAFQQQQAAVAALHEVVFPLAPPSVAGFEVAACYVPYSRGGGIGGDWWEALMLPDGCLALAVGDVAGHGLPAAAIMGQLRNAQRTRLVAGASPAEVLTELSALLDWTHPHAHASSIVMVIEPATGEFVWSTAGHPPPMLVAGSQVEILGAAAGPPLGVLLADAPEYAEHRGVLAPGATAFLYTDGLLESRVRPLDDGLVELGEAAALLKPDSLQHECERLVARLVERPEDDVCLVVAHRRPCS